MNLAETFRAVNRQISGGRVSASYRPYKELRHTWRSDDISLVFGVSDYMKGADADVTEALAWHLICKARRKHCPEGKAKRYVEQVRSPTFWASRRDLYLSRARNLSFRSRGSYRDLRSAFDYVNTFYFDDRLDAPDLAWVRQSPSARMGFYHMPLRILAVNMAFDSERIPRYVLEFVMYHELLHGILGDEPHGGRRIHHTRRFREMEKDFTRYDEAQEWLTRIASRSKGRGGSRRVVPQV